MKMERIKTVLCLLACFCAILGISCQINGHDLAIIFWIASSGLWATHSIIMMLQGVCK